jgi:hypothetical protein
MFNNLANIMDTHVNRMLVLRPQLTAAERSDFEGHISLLDSWKTSGLCSLGAG